MATEKAPAAASPTAGGHALLPPPPIVATRVQAQPVRVGRATGVWVSNGIDAGNLIENVHDLPNMPGWVKCDGAEDLDKDLAALCDQLNVPKLFQHWLAYWRMH